MTCSFEKVKCNNKFINLIFTEDKLEMNVPDQKQVSLKKGQIKFCRWIRNWKNYVLHLYTDKNTFYPLSNFKESDKETVFDSLKALGVAEDRIKESSFDDNINTKGMLSVNEPFECDVFFAFNGFHVLNLAYSQVEKAEKNKNIVTVRIQEPKSSCDHVLSTIKFGCIMSADDSDKSSLENAKSVADEWCKLFNDKIDMTDVEVFDEQFNDIRLEYPKSKSCLFRFCENMFYIKLESSPYKIMYKNIVSITKFHQTDTDDYIIINLKEKFKKGSQDFEEIVILASTVNDAKLEIDTEKKVSVSAGLCEYFLKYFPGKELDYSDQYIFEEKEEKYSYFEATYKGSTTHVYPTNNAFHVLKKYFSITYSSINYIKFNFENLKNQTSKFSIEIEKKHSESNSKSKESKKTNKDIIVLSEISYQTLKPLFDFLKQTRCQIYDEDGVEKKINDFNTSTGRRRIIPVQGIDRENLVADISSNESDENFDPNNKSSSSSSSSDHEENKEEDSDDDDDKKEEDSSADNDDKKEEDNSAENNSD